MAELENIIAMARESELRAMWAFCRSEADKIYQKMGGSGKETLNKHAYLYAETKKLFEEKYKGFPEEEEKGAEW